MKLNQIVTLNLNIEGVAKKYQSSEGGLNAKGRAHYNSKGHNLKTPVTKKQAKGSPKSAGRRKSFCSRMGGQKKMYNIDCRKDPEKAICKSLKRWDCNENIVSKVDYVINEIFNEKIPYKWTRQLQNWWSAEFKLMTKLGQTKVMLDLSKMDSEGTWDVSFATSAPGYEFGSYDIINTGKAYSIFSTIMAAIKEWISLESPSMLIFSASNNSRIRLYKKMIGKYLPPGWTSATIPSGGEDELFVAKHGKITQKDLMALDQSGTFEGEDLGQDDEYW